MSAGTEAVFCLRRTATWLRTVRGQKKASRCFSVNTVGAFDHVCRTMLRGLLERPLRPLLPYARQFYAENSSISMTMPGTAIRAACTLRPPISVFAFLDDMYVTEPD